MLLLNLDLLVDFFFLGENFTLKALELECQGVLAGLDLLFSLTHGLEFVDLALLAVAIDILTHLLQLVCPSSLLVDLAGVEFTAIGLETLLKLVEVEDVGHSEFLEGRLFVLVLSKLGLHIFEEGA